MDPYDLVHEKNRIDGFVGYVGECFYVFSGVMWIR